MKTRWMLIPMGVAAFAFHARAGALVYDEAAERVMIGEGAQKIEFKWDAKSNGFVTPRGDWVAWDNGANGWLMVPKAGPRARFDAAGNFAGREEVAPVAQPKPVKPAAVGGYDPTQDAGDTPADSGEATKAAFDYLSQRDAALAAKQTNSIAGDSGGGAIQLDALGGDAAGRRKQSREAFKMRPGAHAADPDAVMETGAVKDPLQSLMESMQSLSAMASGVQGAIQNAGDLEKDIRKFHKGGSGAPLGAQPTPSDNNPLPPAAGGGQQLPPGGAYGQPPGYGQNPGGYQAPGFGGFGGGVGGYGGGAGGGGNIGGKPPGGNLLTNPGQGQQAPPGTQQNAGNSNILPQGAVPQGGAQGVQQQAAP